MTDRETTRTIGTDTIRVKIRGLVTERRVGIHPWEQHAERPNRLLIDVDLEGDHQPPGPDGARTIIDYDAIREAVRGWPALPHTPHLETLAEELLDLCFANPAVGRARVSILKPDIFNEAAGVGIEITRSRTGQP